MIVAALALFATLGGVQDRDGAPCRAGRVAVGYRCDPCGRILGETDMRDGRCKRCDEKPREIEYCVKRLKPVFLSTCVHKKKMAAPFRCCGKVHRTATYPEDRARLTYSCRSCGAQADARADLKHKDGCANAFTVDKTCAKSGVAPHVN